tara:strand:+ start:385 stop:1260 length:876 start_codon:yes stop_codon:yes gene_type:complete
MFRKGGEVGGGITSGMRTNFENGTELSDREQYEEIINKYREQAVDPVAQLLIQGGLRGMSTAGRGGTLANLAAAFEQPTSQLFQNIQRQKDLDQELELAGLKMDISERKEKEALEREERRIKEGQEFQRELLGEKQEFEKDILGLEQAGKEKLQLLKNAAGGDKTAIQKLVDQSIRLGTFPDTEEGRKQAFEFYTLSSGDLLRSSMADRVESYAKTEYPAEGKVGRIKANFDLQIVPQLEALDYKVDKLNSFVNSRKEIKLKKLRPNFVYFDLATETPLFFDGTRLKKIEF